MKKQSQKTKGNKGPKNVDTVSTKKRGEVDSQSGKSGGTPSPSKRTPRPAQKTAKKPTDAGPGATAKFIEKAGRFLREAKVELKKVKWPTRKELIASTAVVIVLTLLVAFYLGLVDFGLIKIIRNVVG